MASGQIGAVARQFHRLFGGGTVSGMSEGELVRRFATRRDPAALESLVARHGPMVLGVCRRVLGNSHDAEDAFQATFLVLAKRAGTIRDPDRLGPWLHGVAHRVAVRSRANAAKRRTREQSGVEDAAMVTSSSECDFDRAELRATLDEEVRRLPEKFRTPVILCYLDGLTHDDAAARLRCPVGTIRSRLATGRDKLRERLTRRGVTVPSAVFAAALATEAASASVPSLLLDSTVRSALAFTATGAGATAAGVVSASVSSLAEGVTTTMMITKVKVLGGVLLAGMLTVGAGGAAAQRFGGGGQEKADRPREPALARYLAQLEDAEVKVKGLRDAMTQAEAELATARERYERASSRIRGGSGKGPRRNVDNPIKDEDQVKKLEGEIAKLRRELEVAQAKKGEDTAKVSQPQVEKFMLESSLKGLQDELVATRNRLTDGVAGKAAALEDRAPEGKIPPEITVKRLQRTLEGMTRELAAARAQLAEQDRTRLDGARIAGSGEAGPRPGGIARDVSKMKSAPGGSGMGGPGLGGPGGMAAAPGATAYPGMMGAGGAGGAGGRDGSMPGMGGAGGMAGMAGMMGGGGFGGQPGMPGGSGMAGMMGGMGGGKGGFPGQPPQSLATIQTDEYVVVHKPKSDKVAAYSTETGEWTSYEVPKGTDVSPIASGGIVALTGVGKEVGQIATFVPKTGKWYPIDLKTPAKGQVAPIVGPSVAVYAIGRHVYAFSAPARAWDVLELPEGADALPMVWPNRATVEHDDHLYIFSVKTGKWTDFDAKTGKVVTPEGK